MGETGRGDHQESNGTGMADTVDEQEQAADDAVDQDRVLPGEDLRSHRLDDAVHWATAYRELLSFKRLLVEATTEAMTDMETAAAREEVGQTDLIILRAEEERFARRLAMWERRLAELK